MKQYEHIIWDWNGTLLDDLNVSMEALNQLLKKEGLPSVDTIEAYRRYFQFPVIKYYEKVGFDFNKKPFSELAIGYMDYYQPHSFSCHLHDHAIEILNKIQTCGIPQTLLSASDYAFLMKQVCHFSIQDYFDDILGLNHIHADSKEALATNYIQKHSLQHKAVFIGDSVHDAIVAKAANCDCILVACGHEHKDKLLATDAIVVDCLMDLENLLFSKN